MFIKTKSNFLRILLIHKLELKYRVEKINKIKRVEDELVFIFTFFLRGL